jgi:integrase
VSAFEEHGTQSGGAVKCAAVDVRLLRAHRLASGRPEDGELVFAAASGSPLDAHGLPRAAWRRIIRAAAINETLARFHDLRHIFAS